MKLVRTTLRIEKGIKKEAERKAAELDVTLQKVFNDALDEYLKKIDRRKARSVVFFDQPIDKRLANLTRDDYYAY